MNTAQTALDRDCPRCGTRLFPDAAAGLCPKCLGLVGFGSDSEAEWSVLRRLGDFELIEEIARGGMGVVYKARQRSLNRIVAVKVVLHGPFSSPDFLRRFQTEARAVAGLQHPNIVAIHEVGEDSGNHFLSMDYVEGRNLADAVRENPLPAQQAAAYVQTIAEAIHYAHERGVLHRDLKPSNVLLDPHNQPRVSDFGLAKLLNSEAEVTTAGQVLGSPSHIAPEQAAGKAEAASPACDIYSLGAILYHLVTGRPPFQGESVTDVLLQVQNNEPIAPRKLNPGVPVDLETICLKCLRKEPSHRYATARELAEDLRHFLGHEPIRARPTGWAGRLARWCRRKPGLATSVGLGACLLLLVTIGSPIALLNIERERRAAEAARKEEAAERARAEGAEQEVRRQLFSALVGQAQLRLRSGEAGQRFGTLDALRRAAGISNAPELRREIFAALALPDARRTQALPYAEEFTLRKLDPTFSRLALCRGTGPVQIYATTEGRLQATLPASTNREAHVALWSPDGRYLAVKRDLEAGGFLADWEVWDVTASRLTLLLRSVVFATVAFHPDGKRVAACLEDTSIRFWRLSDGRELSRIPLPYPAFQLAFDPQGERFVAAERGPTGTIVSICATSTATQLASHVSREAVLQLQWHPQGEAVAFLQTSGGVNLLRPDSGKVTVLGRHKAAAVRCEFTPDGAYLLSSGWDNEIICWDLETAQRAFDLALEGFDLQMKGDGRAFSVTLPNALQLFEFAPPTGVREFMGDLGGRLNYAAFSPDGRWLAASGLKYLGVWDLSTRGEPALVSPGGDARVVFGPNNELFGHLQAEGFRWSIQASNQQSAPELNPLPFPSSRGELALCAASNGVVVTCAQGSRLLGSNQALADEEPWHSTPGGVNLLSPNEQWLGIFAPFTSELHVFRFPEFRPATNLACLGNITRFDFSPQGDQVAVGTTRGVEFWSTESWQRTHIATNFNSPLYSPDGRTCWLGTDHRGGALVRRDTLEVLLPISLHMQPIAISRDGNRVAMSIDEQRLQVWDIPKVRRQLSECGMDWAD